MSESPQQTAPFVTFYSYKGGVGRSMAVLNVSALLASRGFRVLIIDFDLEAPGLSHLLSEVAKAKKGAGKNRVPCAGVVELLADAKAKGKDSDLFGKSFPKVAEAYTFYYPIPPELKAHEEGRLYVMPAGKTDSTYSARLTSLDLPGLYQQGLGQGLMLRFKQALAESGLYDYVIIDSRTGHSDEAGICTRDLADHLMVVSGFNRQNLNGTASFLTNLRATLDAENKQVKDPTMILSPVPIGEEDLLSAREKEARDLFSSAWGGKLALDLFIPYHPRLALTEDAYVTTRTASYLRDSYQDIEMRLLMAINHLPGPLLKKAKEEILAGKGKVAISTLHRYAKILASGPRSSASQRQFPFGWHQHWSLEDDAALLERVLALPTPETEAILHIFLETSRFYESAFRLGRNLHERDEPHRTTYDRWLLEKEPADPNLLANYANFLTATREDHDAAEAFYKRAIEADQENAYTLGGYAIFLTDIRKDHDAAEAFYKRAIEADPSNATRLGNYAIFLKNIRKDHDAAEAFYKRAIEANPNHANNLGNYAIFLTDIRKDHDAAEAFYKRAFEADPQNAYTLGNYGQFLLGQGRNRDGLARLRTGWDLLANREDGNAAEFTYALWLGSLLAKTKASAWEGIFKHLVLQGFKRHNWNFDKMLEQAKQNLDEETYLYAKALAEAFLDEAKVPALDSFPRWKALEPLDPKLVMPTQEGLIEPNRV